MRATYWVVKDNLGYYWNKEWRTWMVGFSQATKYYSLNQAETVAEVNRGEVFRVTLSCEEI